MSDPGRKSFYAKTTEWLTPGIFKSRTSKVAERTTSAADTTARRVIAAFAWDVINDLCLQGKPARPDQECYPSLGRQVGQSERQDLPWREFTKGVSEPMQYPKIAC